MEILHSGDDAGAAAATRDLGGDIVGRVEPALEAYVPFEHLVDLEGDARVTFIRPPLAANVSLPQNGTPLPTQAIGEEVAKTNASAWHVAGLEGAGVKVGIVDFFDDTQWNAAQGAGELPVPAGTFCRVNGVNCDIWNVSPSSHGEGVAEIIHEMAPDAQIYLASVSTTADLQAAVNYFASQGVDILSRSLTAVYDGPGDGTSRIGTVVNSAVTQAIAWFNSAGNSAGSGGNNGAYWRGGWSDPDADNFLNFGATDESLGFVCGFLNGLRWNDWGANKTDYDAFIYDDAALTQLESQSALDQSQAGVNPIEPISGNCSAGGDVDYLVIKKFAQEAARSATSSSFRPTAWTWSTGRTHTAPPYLPRTRRTQGH